MALWLGDPLADLGSDLLTAREGARLSELRLQALETLIEAELQLGRPSEVVGALWPAGRRASAARTPAGLLMLALYQDGRRAEALAAYQHARTVLIDELGTEPGPDLKRLHQQILVADPAVAPCSERPQSSRRLETRVVLNNLHENSSREKQRPATRTGLRGCRWPEAMTNEHAASLTTTARPEPGSRRAKPPRSWMTTMLTSCEASMSAFADWPTDAHGHRARPSLSLPMVLAKPARGRTHVRHPGWRSRAVADSHD